MLEKQILAYRMPIKEECEVNKSFARHPISCLTGREKKEKIVGKGYLRKRGIIGRLGDKWLRKGTITKCLGLIKMPL